MGVGSIGIGGGSVGWGGVGWGNDALGGCGGNQEVAILASRTFYPVLLLHIQAVITARLFCFLSICFRFVSRARAHVCVCLFVRVCVRASLCVCVSLCVHACIYVCVRE